MKSRTMLGAAFVTAALAGHLSLGACGVGMGSAGAANGGGGAGGEACLCVPKAPTVVEVACDAPDINHSWAVLKMDGKSATDLTLIQALGTLVESYTLLGVYYESERAAFSAVADGTVIVNCKRNITGTPQQNYSAVRFVLP